MPSVVVELLSRTAGLEAGMQGMVRSVTRVAAVVTGAGAAIAALTKRAINQADEIGKAAQRAGMLVTQYSKLRGAAELAGVSMETLQTAAKDLSKRMIEAGQGSRPMLEVMLEVADEFQRMPDGALKTARAIELFGESGQKLLPLLNQGSAAIREQMQEYERFGMVVGPEFATNAARFNDGLRRLRNMFDGLWRQLAQAILPSLIQFIEAGIRFVNESGAWEGTLWTLIDLYKIFAETIVRVGSGLLATIGFVADFTASLDRGESILIAGMKAATGYEQALKRMEERIREIRAIGPTTITIEADTALEPIAVSGEMHGPPSEEFARMRDEASYAVQLMGAMDSMIRQIGTTAQQAGRALTDFVGGAVQGIAEGISGLLHLTLSWRDALLHVGQAIISSVINAISRMVAEWIAKRALMAAKEIAFGAMEAAAKAPSALLESIKSYGVAALIGAAAFAGVMAAVGGFASGGVVAGGEQLIRVNEQGTEGVVNARGLAAIGPEMLQRINAGLITASDLAAGIPAGFAAGVPSGGGPAGSAAAGAGPMTVHLLLVDSRNSQAARQFLESAAGRVMIREIVTDERQEIGVPT